MMIGFIDQNRKTWGVEPICKNLQIAPSTYHSAVACQKDPSKLSIRRKKDAELRPHIQRLFDGSTQRYGARKIWHDLKREGREVARCTIELLMSQMSLVGVVRGPKSIRTTFADTFIPSPGDLVDRDFIPKPPTSYG